MIIVLLTFLNILVAMTMYYDFLPDLSDEEARETITILTILTMVAAALETQTRIKWLN